MLCKLGQSLVRSTGDIAWIVYGRFGVLSCKGSLDLRVKHEDFGCGGRSLKAVTATVGEFARTKWVIDRLITLTVRLAYLAPGMLERLQTVRELPAVGQRSDRRGIVRSTRFTRASRRSDPVGFLGGIT